MTARAMADNDANDPKPDYRAAANSQSGQRRVSAPVHVRGNGFVTFGPGAGTSAAG
jgi:hypothetical protein